MTIFESLVLLVGDCIRFAHYVWTKSKCKNPCLSSENPNTSSTHLATTTYIFSLLLVLKFIGKIGGVSIA